MIHAFISSRLGYCTSVMIVTFIMFINVCIFKSIADRFMVFQPVRYRNVFLTDTEAFNASRILVLDLFMKYTNFPTQQCPSVATSLGVASATS